MKICGKLYEFVLLLLLLVEFCAGIPKRQQLTYSTLANILSIESVDSKLKSFDRPSSESDTDSFLIFIGCQLGERSAEKLDQGLCWFCESYKKYICYLQTPEVAWIQNTWILKKTITASTFNPDCSFKYLYVADALSVIIFVELKWPVHIVECVQIS